MDGFESSAIGILIIIIMSESREAGEVVTTVCFIGYQAYTARCTAQYDDDDDELMIKMKKMPIHPKKMLMVTMVEVGFGENGVIKEDDLKEKDKDGDAGRSVTRTITVWKHQRPPRRIEIIKKERDNIKKAGHIMKYQNGEMIFVQ